MSTLQAKLRYYSSISVASCMKIKSYKENGYTEVTFQVPFCNNLIKVKKVNKEDILQAFRGRLIETLERRLEACQRNLLNHLSTIKSNDGDLIVYQRKDGSYGMFNPFSYSLMEKALEDLRVGKVDRLLTDSWWAMQIVEGLLNDPETDHSDSELYKFSDLVSVLVNIIKFQ